MADEPAYRSDGGQAAPDFLTVTQTADVLQIGRSTTYELVGLFVEGDEVRGIPAILVGGQYRIPRGRLEEYAGKPLAWPPAPRQRKPRAARRRKTSDEVPQPTDPRGTAEPGPGEMEAPSANTAPAREDLGPEVEGQPSTSPRPVARDVVDHVSGSAAGRNIGAEAATSTSPSDRADEPKGAEGDPSGAQQSLPFEG